MSDNPADSLRRDLADPRLAAWRAAAEAATPIPWTRDYYYIVSKTPNGRPGGEVIGQMTPSVHGLVPLPQMQANAEFVAAARTAVPVLLDLVDRLEADNQQLREQLKELEMDSDERVPLIRRQAFNEAAEAVEAHRPTLEHFDVGYRAGLELALRAVRGLGDGEKENRQ